MFGKTSTVPWQPDDTLAVSPARTSTRRDALLDMLRTKEGASIEHIVQRFGWKPHSARAMLTGLRKAGYHVQRDSVGGITTYRVSL